MKGSNRFAACYVSGLYSFNVSGQRFHIGDDRHLYDGMLRVICLKLIAGFDRARMIRGMKFDKDCSNLTRLDDFLEVQVARRASASPSEPSARRPNNSPIS